MYNQKEVDKLYPGAWVFEPMRFWSLPDNKRHMISELCESGAYYAQTKKDGHWYEYSKAEDGTAYLFTRGCSTKTQLPTENISKVPHIEEAFKELPPHTVILGEIYYPNETTRATQSIMGSYPENARARQVIKGNIHFYLFDILAYDGELLTEMGSKDRYFKLAEVYEKYNLGQAPEIELADYAEENLYLFLSDNLARGEEGSILKKKDLPYMEAKAPAWSSIKWKKQDDIDLVCMGFDDPTKIYSGEYLETWPYWEVDGELKEGQYYGTSGALPVTKPYFKGWKTSMRFGLYKNDGILTHLGNVSSGLTDELRADAAANPEFYINRVFKCAYMELTEGSVREPRFIEFRDDKKAIDCLFDEVFR